ncbi:MAG: hypothetical protein A3J38_07045 [Gammaproteobacteria bacterium RIFCSPHIGHO2_12_FULL_45_9]|nr:MAG: hypothetical protein A3J38_07045 [Gammaproteobacteria bacterium RIFCSPHIGHO2_12_FULL_45_9]
MSYLLLNADYPHAFKKHSPWFFLWGAALIILGLLAISAATLTTLISVLFIGALLLAGGVILVLDAYKFWWGKWSGFFLHLAMGLLYLIAGYMIIKSPEAGSLSITLLLGVFYTLIGIFRITYSVALRMPRWGWSFVSGLVALLLGFLIVANWPASSLYIIGLFVGIDLVFCGWAYVMAALTARQPT